MKVVLVVDAGGDPPGLRDRVQRWHMPERLSGGIVSVCDREPVAAVSLPTPTAPPVDGFIELWLDDHADPQPLVEDPAAPWSSARVEGYVVDEVVQREYSRAWADDGRPSPGIKAVYLVGFGPPADRARRIRHWRHVHGPLALRHHVGCWKYVQNAVERPVGDADPGIDGIAELHFRTVADLEERMYDSAAGAAAIGADVTGFVARADGYLCTEHVLRWPPPPPADV
jgi:hypothetical protein